MSHLYRFIKRHRVRDVFSLFVEEYIGLLVRFIPGYEGMFLRWLLFKATFKKIGKKSLVWPGVFITHGYNITAGDALAINCGTHIDGRGGLTIGNHALIGPNVFIGSSNHALTVSPEAPRLFAGHFPSPVSIGSNVWIGANAVICPGVSIGDNSIIGAGSVVTKDIPANVLVAGNPARIIRPLEKDLQTEKSQSGS